MQHWKVSSKASIASDFATLLRIKQSAKRKRCHPKSDFRLWQVTFFSTKNIGRDLVKQLVSGQLPNKSHHLDELTHEPAIWSCDTGQWLSCFDGCQLTILWMSNIKDVDLQRHAWDNPSFLLIVSPTPPIQSINAYVRTSLGQSRDNQTKRGWPYSMSMGLCHTRASRVGAPLLFTCILWENIVTDTVNHITHWNKQRNHYGKGLLQDFSTYVSICS